MSNSVRPQRLAPPGKLRYVGSSAPTRHKTRAPCIGSAGSQSLDHKGSPWTWHLLMSSVTLISCWKHPFMVQGQLKERAHSAGSTESAVFTFKSLSGKPAIFMEPQLDPKSPPRVSGVGFGLSLSLPHTYFIFQHSHHHHHRMWCAWRCSGYYRSAGSCNILSPSAQTPGPSQRRAATVGIRTRYDLLFYLQTTNISYLNDHFYHKQLT